MNARDASVPLSPELPRPKRKRRRLILLVLLLAVVGFVVWVATSRGPAAQVIQELAGWKQDQTILATPFTVGPHTFRYYKFSVPPGSVNMAVVGQFSAVGENANSGVADQSAKGEPSAGADSNVEVFILGEAGFMMWQHGVAASSLYDSGLVSTGTLQADLPADAGTYYLVFSNKASPKTAKTVHATVGLRYRNWLRRVFTR
jgi:hypothetical protein